MPAAATSLQELSGLLWRERDVLDQLLVVLSAGAHPSQCDGLLRSVSSLELHRAITSREAAVELGVDGEATLRTLAAASDGEWGAVLSTHRLVLRKLVGDVANRLQHLDPERASGVQRSLLDFLG